MKGSSTTAVLKRSSWIPPDWLSLIGSAGAHVVPLSRGDGTTRVAHCHRGPSRVALVVSYSLLISFTFSFTFSRVFPFQWHSSHSAFPPRSLYREFVSACREFCRLVAISHHFGHLDLCDLSLGIARPPSPAGIPSALRAYPLCSACISPLLCACVLG